MYNVSVCSFYGWLASHWQVYKRSRSIRKRTITTATKEKSQTRERTTTLQAVHKTHKTNGRTRDTHFPHKMFTLCKFLWMSRRKIQKKSTNSLNKKYCCSSGKGGGGGDDITIFNSYLSMQTGSANSVLNDEAGVSPLMEFNFLQNLLSLFFRWCRASKQASNVILVLI